MFNILLKNGGLDYILKPIDRHEIITAFDKAIEDLKMEAAKRSIEIQRNVVISQIKPVFLDKMFSNLILQPELQSEALSELDKEFHLTNYDQFKMAIIKTDILHEKIMDKYVNNIDILDSILLNVCNEIIGQTNSGYAFKHLNKENEILIITWENFNRFQQQLQKINMAFIDILHTAFHFGISNIHPLPKGLQLGYKEAMLALRQSNFLRKNQFIHPFDDIDSNKQNDLFFSDFSDAIMIAIKSNDYVQIKKAVKEFIHSIKQLDSITLNQLEYWRNEFTLMRSYLYKEILFEEKAEVIHKQLYFPLNKVGSFSFELFEKKLILKCKSIADELTEEIRKSHNIIFDIKKYIDNHFHEDLMLQSLADNFYISREYLSRKFKQEFGINASDYIENVRIENAKVLLLNNQLNISDIANTVGYQDARYFSKVFKKVVGVSPINYKRALK